MAVSKQPLGLNARNYLYIRPMNRRGAKALADDKLATKRRLLAEDIPTTKLIKAFRSFREVRMFKWEKLTGDFVLKPARGYGGAGIKVVRKWTGSEGKVSGGGVIELDELEAEIFSILDGGYSLDNLPDVAFLEERVIVSSTMSKLSAGGVPDIRVIVCNKVPIMAMLRLPTVYSEGKANLQQGAIGIGIDLRTGITTKGVFYGEDTLYIPGTKTKVRGIKIPEWDKLLDISVRTQIASKLGYAGIDIVLDENKGPLVLEVNARPGLKIQLANGASLRTRLERVSDMKVASPKHGIDIARRLFAETALADVPADSNILHVVEKVTVFGPKGKKVVHAKVDTGAYRTALDVALVEELGFDRHHEKVHIRSGAGRQTRHTVEVTLRLRGKDIKTIASYNDRAHMRFPMIIGRRDLKGFLVDPTLYADDVT